MTQEQKDILHQYLIAGEDEKATIEREFARLFCNSQNLTELETFMRQDWKTIPEDELSDKDLSHVLHRIHFLINSEKTQLSNKPKGLVVWKWYSRIAAVLLLPLMLWAVSQFHKADVHYAETTSNVQVVAPLGSRIKVSLPDGSSAWLNSGSVLEYEVPFNERRLAVKGEAFFDVTTDSLRPLIVEGPRTFIKVLGTKFNVKMWPDEEITEVVLAEGSVEMTPKGTNQNLVMVPGDLFIYNKEENHLYTDRVVPAYYSAWIEGKLVLRNLSLEQVARELSRWFNVEVEVNDTELLDHEFRATFEDEKLEEVLRLLKMTAPFEYEIIDSRQKANGDFERKKVVIRRE